MSYSFAYITAADLAEAQKIGSTLVDKQLAACVNIFENMQSMYKWKGKVETDRETVLVAKTTDSLKEALLQEVKQIHSYECPCVVFLPVTGGNPDFLDWIKQETIEK
ncbi:divalent-cation tolerance protein CutA [Desulfonatronovibrio magnus]|uniref:divalent-cation tolerance protein CutA n=1 Tax=Desulfonatronovibrio magnus TaxID=698827 RepID=UPI0005EBCDAA|nr:divalent-cation tolerance protein CutA [Desulfonatronovibrio magnus]